MKVKLSLLQNNSVSNEIYNQERKKQNSKLKSPKTYIKVEDIKANVFSLILLYFSYFVEYLIKNRVILRLALLGFQNSMFIFDVLIFLKIILSNLKTH